MVRCQRLTSVCVLAWCLTVLGILSAPVTVLAGPPFLTDDPQPTANGHWEIYNFAQATLASGALDGEAGLDLSFGVATDLQLSAVLPIGFENKNGFSSAGFRTSTGTIELGAKYKVLHQVDSVWLPEVSVSPTVLIPTDHDIGHTRANIFLPVWAGTHLGAWSLFGGGGYQINPGPGVRNFWQGGFAVDRLIGERLQLGVEVYGQTADTAEGGGYAALNFGATYKLNEHWALLVSAGPTWTQERVRGGVFYLSLKAEY